MEHTEQWIWLPKEQYPKEQNTVFSGFYRNQADNYTVAEFDKQYVFDKTVVKAELRFSADTAFQLYCNGSILATGPACVGGDFIGNETVREPFYAFQMCIEPHCEKLHFFARVKMLPVQICEYSKGHGGFMFSAIFTYSDGSQIEAVSDESWLVRKHGAYIGPRYYDGTKKADAFVQAECMENIWNTITAPIPVREERELFPEHCQICVKPQEEKHVVLELDRIWGGFLHVQIQTKGEVSVLVSCLETEEKPQNKEKVVAVEDVDYRGFFMHSAGKIEADIKSNSLHPAQIQISFIKTHYPVLEEAETVTSDPALNQVLETCKHTLKICRQTHHLDSPRHCEPMACTGDYYIESLMTPFSFGDMKLAEFDLIRTAVMLERENGRMFHTTYSLIWVRMLYDVYLFTGNLELLKTCERALQLLLDRFETYLGENGLVETPPDYMFVDWIYIDECSMHHPPKALGQTCLNMFYVQALEYAGKIFQQLGLQEKAAYYGEQRKKLQDAINLSLFDAEKGIYFEGLNTPTEEALLGEWMPQNVEKRYYLKHSNILAAYVGACDDQKAKELIEKVLADEIEGACQPYFMHYLLEAINRLGMREKATLRVVEQWKAPVCECPKGLVEGFVMPEPAYYFDHSHAWGGTPLYSVPKALFGLEILTPGMKKISLSPSLLGLAYAKTELLTPHGKVVCEMQQGKEPIITAPKEIEITIR